MLSYKSDKDEKITKTEARLVAKGFVQRKGLDYLQTSASTPAAASVKIVGPIANEVQCEMYQLDVEQAFTKAMLDYVVYMKLPGSCGDLSGKYVRLEKALRGLKQSGLLRNDPRVVHGLGSCLLFMA